MSASSDASSITVQQDQGRYLDARFVPDPRRDTVWRHIVNHLRTEWTPAAAVLDVGAGYCSFINAVNAARRVAVDLHPRLAEHAATGVEAFNASATDMPMFADQTFDVVFASNLLEHLSRDDIVHALGEFRRILRPDGRLILIQPNYRLCVRRYFDDYTHLTPLSDVSLGDLLVANGYRVLRGEARFLPFSLKSRFSGLTGLVPYYLRSPIKPLAGQMLFIAQPDTRD